MLFTFVGQVDMYVINLTAQYLGLSYDLLCLLRQDHPLGCSAFNGECRMSFKRAFRFIRRRGESRSGPDSPLYFMTSRFHFEQRLGMLDPGIIECTPGTIRAVERQPIIRRPSANIALHFDAARVTLDVVNEGKYREAIF